MDKENTGSIIVSQANGFLQHVRCARALVFVNFFTAAFAVAIIRRFDSLGRTQAYPIPTPYNTTMYRHEKTGGGETEIFTRRCKAHSATP